MRYQRQLLAEKLEKLNSFVDAKDSIIQSSCYIFTGTQVVAFSGNEIAIINMKSDFQCAVSKADFFSYVEKLKDTDIEITIEDDALTIKGKNKSAQIPVYLEINEAYKAVTIPKTFEELDQGTFYPALDTAIQFTSKSSDEYVDQCVEFHGNKMFASDRKVVAALTVGTDIGQQVSYIHASSAKKLVGVQCAKWAITDEFMFFNTDDVIVGARIYLTDQTRLSADELATYADTKGVEFKLPPELPEAVDRIKGVYGEGPLLVAVKGGVLHLHTYNKTGSAQIKMREKMRVIYKGDPFKFVIELGFLKTLLDMTDTCSIAKELSIVTATVHDDSFIFSANFDEV